MNVGNRANRRDFIKHSALGAAAAGVAAVEPFDFVILEKRDEDVHPRLTKIADSLFEPPPAWGSWHDGHPPRPVRFDPEYL